MKRKKSERTKLMEKADRIFSQYIRMLDADENGYVKCTTCNVKRHWKEMHAGHYVPRQHLTLRWEETNVHPQCPSCNTFNEGRSDEYALFLMKEYGKTHLEWLNQRKWAIAPTDEKRLQEIIDHYIPIVEALEEGKKLCWCGKFFNTVRGLRTHQTREHNPSD